jgi:hypothetical protein
VEARAVRRHDRPLSGVVAMTWDLGPGAVGLLLALSLAFGVLAQLVAGRGAAVLRRLWIIAGATFFAAGLLTSEVWFGWATEEDLQPNVDGLSVDESLLAGLVAGVASVVITRYVARRGASLS